MKKVRFETSNNFFKHSKMNESECHSPRPFIEKQIDIKKLPIGYEYPRVLPFSVDPVQRFETSNSSPYSVIKKTNLDHDSSGSSWSPSNELELSILDASNLEPRKPNFSKHLPFVTSHASNTSETNVIHDILQEKSNVLSSVENINTKKPSKINSDNSFFITRGNLSRFQIHNLNPLNKQIERLSMDKENNPIARKQGFITMNTQLNISKDLEKKSPYVDIQNDCICHHCTRNTQNKACSLPQQCNHVNPCKSETPIRTQCLCIAKPLDICNNCNNVTQRVIQNTCQCNSKNCCMGEIKNPIDKKTWVLERYEENRNTKSKDIEKQNHVKEKREPTVSDLFKIIKLQNEQLQLLQEKVDKFITASNSRPSSIPIQSYTTEHVAVESVNSDQHKISIGVMTSFEIRASTIINKEVMKQKNESSQIHCNKSQISIKEVLSSQPVNENFLDGITPVAKCAQNNLQESCANRNNTPCMNVEEKTLNELSLYNVQVDNATTPLMSPEQTLYLDVRDYSDSDSGSDQSNVGWTYYNKVMTHVNGMLQDSDMPSSASALYRNTRQQCLQMQIDKTNVSVTKRVKFGDDPLGIHQPHLYAATTDTSLKMNQLAAKYLKKGFEPPAPPAPVTALKSSVPFDMSFATRNYMERHKLLQGSTKSAPGGGLPRFLDITALKQQPKLL